MKGIPFKGVLFVEFLQADGDEFDGDNLLAWLMLGKLKSWETLGWVETYKMRAQASDIFEEME